MNNVRSASMLVRIAAQDHPEDRMPARQPRLTLLGLTIAVSACYSPHYDPAGDSRDDRGGGDEASAETAAKEDTAAETTSMLETSSTSELSSDGSATDPPGLTCGDGQTDIGEACDEGVANSPDAGCRPDCSRARCGDGDVWLGVEGCDEGDGMNALDVGACAPDCSKVIGERAIRLGAALVDGDFGQDVLATADSSCPAGYLALLVSKFAREAAMSAFDTSDGIDWVLQPYTAYVREDGTLIWITDEVALLGVRDGAQVMLLDSILACDGQCEDLHAVSGIDDGWVRLTSGACQGFGSDSVDETIPTGDPYSPAGFLDAGPLLGCDDLSRAAVYCVEQ
jgi:Protein of unknown function (DUF1554)